MKNREDIIIELSSKATEFAKENMEYVDIDLEHLPFRNFTFYFPISSLANDDEKSNVAMKDLVSLASEVGVTLDPIQYAKLQHEMLNKKVYVNVQMGDNQIRISGQDSDRVPLLEFKVPLENPSLIFTKSYFDGEGRLKSLIKQRVSDKDMEIMAMCLLKMTYNVLAYLVKPKEKIDRIKPIVDGVYAEQRRVRQRTNSKKAKYITKKVYVVYDFEPLLPKKPRQFTRRTESWNVCGHWRHYKSGKKTWIPQGTRGDKSKKTQAQTYKITDMK